MSEELTNQVQSAWKQVASYLLTLVVKGTFWIGIAFGVTIGALLF